MKRFTIITAALIAIGILLNSLGAFLYENFPMTREVYVGKIFLDGKTHVDGGKDTGLTLSYFLYELFPYLFNVIVFALWYWSVKEIYIKLSRILLVFLGYFIAETFFYWFDRNTSLITNWVLFTALAWVIVELSLPDKKTGKYRTIFKDYD